MLNLFFVLTYKQKAGKHKNILHVEPLTIAEHLK